MARSVPKCKRAAYVYDRDFIVVDDISGVLKMRSECAIDGYGFLSSQGDIRNPQEIPPIINEQMVPLFEQPYPEAQIRMVIDKVLALSAEQGVGEAPVEKIEPEEEEAIAALDAGDYATAEAAYKKLLARKPGDSFATLGLAQTQLLGRTDGLDGAKIMQDAVAAPDDLEIQIQCADIEVVSGYLEPAFARLLRLIQTFDGPEKKIAKDRLLELFALVDPADPRVIKARAALANALF